MKRRRYTDFFLSNHRFIHRFWETSSELQVEAVYSCETRKGAAFKQLEPKRMNCHQCEHPNLHGSNFCEKCGHDLKAPPPPKVVPVRPYRSYGDPPPAYPPRQSSYRTPVRPSPAPAPTPAPAPRPAGSPPPAQAVPPAPSHSHPSSPPPAPSRPQRSAPPAERTRRRSHVVSPEAQPKEKTYVPSARPEVLPFAHLRGEKDGREFALRYDENLIGRTSEGVNPQVDLADVDLNGTVSRRHARIGKDESSVFVEDLGSSNGTRLNGQALRVGMQTPLSDGDKLIFGDLVFQIQMVQ